MERGNRAGEGIRTLDIDVGNVTLYQLSYARAKRKNKATATKVNRNETKPASQNSMKTRTKSGRYRQSPVCKPFLIEALLV